ncbi:MAG: tetratricopeptide repeat protein [Bacteroidota bacterium]
MNEARIVRLRQFLEKDPDDSFSRYALALEYAGQGKTETAVETFLEVLRRDPRYVPAYQHLGYTYLKLGRRDEAAAIFRQGIEVAGQQGDTHARSEIQDALGEMEM